MAPWRSGNGTRRRNDPRTSDGTSQGLRGVPGGSQRRHAGERGLAARQGIQVDEVKEVVGIGVAVCNTWQVELAVKRREQRSMVVEHRADVSAALGVRRHHDGRHAEAVARVPVVQELSRQNARGNGVAQESDGRRHMVVVAAVLVIRQDEHSLEPLR